MPKQPVTEFSRSVNVEELERGEEIRRQIDANAEEREALAGRLDLSALESLYAEVTLRRIAGGDLIRAAGRLEADVVQRCVVTLRPIRSHIDEQFEEIYAPEGYIPAENEEEELSEYFDGRQIDVGEMVAQLLSLALDPYPRAPDAEPAILETGNGGPDEGRKPFEGLAEMLKNRK